MTSDLALLFIRRTMIKFDKINRKGTKAIKLNTYVYLRYVKIKKLENDKKKRKILYIEDL